MKDKLEGKSTSFGTKIQIKPWIPLLTVEQLNFTI